LFLEIHPPDIDGRVPVSTPHSEGTEVPRQFYHDWTELFNDVAELVEASAKSGNLKRMTWFVDWTMAHSFYKHMRQHASSASLPTTIKRIDCSSLNRLSRLSLTLASQMGTRPFLDAVRGMRLTDLALIAYDLNLLNGTVFREFCASFPGLRNLRLKLRTPSITVGEENVGTGEGVANEVGLFSS
jgi:hypothetical protein